MKISLLFLLILMATSYVSCSESGKEKYTDVYDLSFKMRGDPTIAYNWIPNAAYTYLSLLTPTMKDSLNPFYILSYNKKYSVSEYLRYELEQRILLPTHNVNHGKISFEGKGENINSAYLVINGLSGQEKILFSDTLRLALDTLLISTKSILLKDVELLNIRIYAEGKKNTNAQIALSRVDIFLGEKHIDQYPLRKLTSTLKKAEFEIVPINIDSYKGFEEIDVTKGKKIIGIGESLHRNNCVNNLAGQFIMQQVENENCKLVLLERPFETSLVYNRYIQENNFELDIDSLKNPDLIKLLDSLKEYNLGKKSEDKVKLFGVDYNSSLHEYDSSAANIFDYITTENENLKAKELDQLAILLIEKDWQSALFFLKENKVELEKHLSTEIYKCITHILSLSYSIGVDKAKRYIKRDSVMFENTKFFIDNFSPPNTSTIVYAHSGHLNRMSTYPAIPCTPLGSYLNQQYADEYSALLLLVGEGSLSYKTDIDLVSNKLLSPPNGSIEYLLGSFNQDALYCTINSDFDKLVLSRSIGAQHISQEFYPFNLYQRYDGILFMKDCPSTDKNDAILTLNEKMRKLMDENTSTKDREKLKEEMDKSFEEMRNKLINQTKEKERLLEEIKKRLLENNYH